MKRKTKIESLKPKKREEQQIFTLSFQLIGNTEVSKGRVILSLLWLLE
jgi:hypothetical protein